MLHLLKHPQRRCEEDYKGRWKACYGWYRCGSLWEHCLLFLVASGKRVVSTWKEPLCERNFTGSQGIPHWLCGLQWFPSDTALHVTKNGSVDRHIIVKIAEHINKHARKTISSDKHIVLLVDGQSSRDGLQWLETCERLNIIVVRLPANTTHILQPCDQYVNRSFQRIVRKTRDELLSMSHLSWANTSYKIKLAVAGHQSITPEDARASFAKCCMWPMDYRFIYLAPSDGSSDGIETRSGTSFSSTASPFVTQTRHGVMRTQNIKLQNEIHQLTDGRLPACGTLAQVACLLQSNYRVQNILSHEVRAPKTASRSRTARKNSGKMQEAAVLTSNVPQRLLQAKQTSNCDHASSKATKTQ